MTTRPPRPPAREAVNPDELAAYDHIVERFAGIDRSNQHPMATPHVAFEALLVSPPIAAGLSHLGKTLMDLGNGPGTWTFADHEFIDLVLSFDLGYWGLLAFHTPQAIAEGVRLEAVAALRHGREEDLTSDELLQVRFIREVVRGTVTDESWSVMSERLGSDRGVVEYCFFVTFLWLHIRLHQALGIPSVSEDGFDELLEQLADGSFPLPPSIATGRYGSYASYRSG